MVSIGGILESIIGITGMVSLKSFGPEKQFQVWMVVMAVTILGVTIYSFDIDPSWIAAIVISGGVGLLGLNTALPVFSAPAVFIAAGAWILYRRYRG